MALKQLILSRKIESKRSELEKAQAVKAELDEKRKALQTRESELEDAVREITEETEETVKAEVEAAVSEFEAEVAQVEADQAEADKNIVDLQADIEELQGELDALNEKVEGEPAPADEEAADESRAERKVNTMYKTRSFAGRSAEQVRAIMSDNGVKTFISTVRAAMSEKRAITNAGLLIPDVLLGLVREEVARQSKLLPYVNHRYVGGTSRMNITGAIPEGVWTEMCANINDLTLAFHQVEVDGYKVGGYLAICNAVLEDADIDLAGEIVDAISGAIAKALDKAILFGTGTKMPVGIVTRLAQTSQPANWGTNAPDWTDLHTSNIQKLNIKASAGTSFFIPLVEKLAIAKPKYSGEGLFWAMNRKTHLDILAKALEFDSSAALVSNTTLMPVLGGAIVEFDDTEMADYEIIGGFGGNYLLAERAEVKIASSDIPLFLADQTVFKGTARYDGQPLAGEAFVIVNYNNTDATTSATFSPDDANTVKAIRLNTSTASIAGTGTFQLYAITEPGKGEVTWASGTSAKATVSSTGLVTGVTAGTSVITATCNGLTASCTVTVT